MSDPESDFMQRARARSEAKNQAIRDQLVPLEPGERPLAVTIGAIVALVLAIGNLVAYFIGRDQVTNETGALVQIILICGILVIAAVGMWFRRYWAVLGFQTILGIQIIIYSLSLTRAQSVWVVLLFVAIIAVSGLLFWYLIRAMARIQMPEGPNQKKLREEIEAAQAADAASDRQAIGGDRSSSDNG